MGALWNLLFLLITIGVLVTVHEFGHFWVARRCGIAVRTFSIGFGPSLWTRTGRDGVEYRIAAIPLGGYVRMVDERDGDPVAEHERAGAFNRQSVWRRFATVAAGPLANFLFAILAFAAMYMVGVSDLRPRIAEPAAGTPAARAGLRAGDEIVAIENEAIAGWEPLTLTLLKHVSRDTPLTLTVRDASGERQVRIAPEALQISGREADLAGQIGLHVWFPPVPAVVGHLEPGQAGEQAGLQLGDTILSVDGQAIADWQALVAAVRAAPGKAVTLAVRRAGQERTLVLQPKEKIEQDQRIGYAGVGPARVDLPAGYRTQVQLGVVDALQAGWAKTGEMIALVVDGLGKLVTGRLSVETLSGPVTIAQGAGATASAGADRFLWFLGLISVNLGLINLLPVPALDGGHLLFFMWEMVRGRPAPERVQAFGMRLGMALIGSLMLIALYNDFARLL